MAFFHAKPTEGIKPQALCDSRGKPASRRMREFAEKMREAGFEPCDLRANLPSKAEHKSLMKEHIGGMDRFPAFAYAAKRFLFPWLMAAPSFPKGLYIYNRNTYALMRINR